MIHLPNVTLVCVDTINYGQAVNAIQKSLREIKPKRVVFFTDIVMDVPGVEIIKIRHFYNKSDYSKWMMKELGRYEFDTSHILIIQHDGFVLDSSQWDDEYFKYDYLGAVWPFETDGYSVGNGGFSLRSVKLHKALAEDDTILGIQPEDVGICRIYRNYLEQKHGIVFAPEELAHKFSYELHQPKDKTFGFHGKFHDPYYYEPIVIKRTAAIGDVIQTEPVLEHFHRMGHPVYLDTSPDAYGLFANHTFKVGDYRKFDSAVIKHRVINLDMAYETKPAQLHLKSYFEYAGITDYQLRNPILNRMSRSMFPKKPYVVIHIDERETTHRNIHGVSWDKIVHNIRNRGFDVFHIGKGQSAHTGATYIDCVNTQLLLWVVSCCELFIGIDSGPSHVAVATDRKCLLFFGSVNPHFIHHDTRKIEIMQSRCPVGTQDCWHLTPSVRGQDCTVDVEQPPCTVHSTRDVVEAIDRALKR